MFFEVIKLAPVYIAVIEQVLPIRCKNPFIFEVLKTVISTILFLNRI